MTNDKQDILNLLNRIAAGNATDEDIERYNRWCNAFQEEGLPVPDNIEGITGEMWKDIRKKMHLHAKSHQLRVWTKVAVAASVILALAFGGYYFLQGQKQNRVAKEQADLQTKDIAPGGNKAILTLANGKTIVLDSAHVGQLAKQGNSLVKKAGSGLLLFQSSRLKAQGLKLKTQSQRQIRYNTLKIPRGGQYQLVLPDGTKVWLNAVSSIRFPTAFTGKTRQVTLTGEAYMEVAEDAGHPFVVTAGEVKVTVLGTHFNIMAYENEPAIKTTLLEGSVKVSVPGKQQSVIIKPGQQASIENKDQHFSVKKVNAANIAAWTQGLLSLKDCSVQEFMNQLSRWYDVDIQYTGKVPEQKIGGLINRNTPLSDMLSALNAAGIPTRLAGKKIIILSQSKK